MPKQNLSLKTSENVIEEKGEIIPSSLLLKAGTYFGHRTKEWNPKMKKFIHSKRKGIHIIDVSKTLKALEWAYKIINQAAAKGATFVFVGTKKHGKAIVKEEALRSNSYYVSERWLGGTLTNSRTIFKQVKKLADLEVKAAKNFEGYTKKEGINFTKDLQKLQKNFEGIRDMHRQPNFMIAIDPVGDRIAVTEARRKGVKIIGIVDTNSDPDLVDLAIPANDDSIKSIKLILTLLADAIVQAKGGEQILAYQDNESFIEGAQNRERHDGERGNFRRDNNRDNYRRDNNRDNYRRDNNRENYRRDNNRDNYRTNNEDNRSRSNQGGYYKRKTSSNESSK